MTSRLRRHIHVLAILVAVSFAACAEDGAKTFLWKATSAGNTVYLLGSIHVATEDFYPLAPEIEKAYADSKKLVVEVNAEDEAAKAEVMKMAMEKGIYKDGGTLSKNLSKPTLDAVKAWSKASGMPLEQVDSFRPWMLALTVTMLEIQKLGFKPELGIDKHFIDAAAKEKKPILELETMGSQLGLLSGFSDELQDKFLLHSVTEMEEMKPNITRMATAWKGGDAKALEDLMIKESEAKHPELKPVMVKLLDERNVPMAEKIDGYLKGNEIHFVVVGAGHLIGEKGIVNLLQKKGYKLEQISRAQK